jgi:histidinol-phosphate aminotransferase
MDIHKMQLIRPHLQDIPPYIPIEPYDVLSARYGFSESEIIKLDANENPYGYPDTVAAALSNLKHGHIYPDPESRQLRRNLSDYCGVPISNLIAGAGADELIDLVVRLTLDPGDKIINCPPTFGMYVFDTRVNAGQVVNIPRNQNFLLDIDRIIQAVREHRPKLIFLACPNNPDGSMITDLELNRILELPVLVVLDEAYIEFSNPTPFKALATRINEVKSRQNLIVLRSFSKWAGLAGFRVGFGAFPDWMMPYLWNSKQPYNVNVAASQAAIAALENLDSYHFSLSAILSERETLHRALSRLPFLSPYPSNANFILCQVKGIPASTLKEKLAREFGILIRYFDSPGLQDHIRISVGKPEHTTALVSALEEIYTRRNDDA